MNPQQPDHAGSVVPRALARDPHLVLRSGAVRGTFSLPPGAAWILPGLLTEIIFILYFSDVYDSLNDQKQICIFERSWPVTVTGVEAK